MAARTARDWVEYAEWLHRQGVAAADSLNGTDVPSDVALARLAHVRAYFAGAGAAAAIAQAADQIAHR